MFAVCWSDDSTSLSTALPPALLCDRAELTQVFVSGLEPNLFTSGRKI